MTQFQFTTVIPAYNAGPRECREKLIRYSPTITNEIITDFPFEAMNQEALEKPAFFFGDSVKNSNEILFEEETKWLHQTNDLLIFLRDMERSYHLGYL